MRTRQKKGKSTEVVTNPTLYPTLLQSLLLDASYYCYDLFLDHPLKVTFPAPCHAERRLTSKLISHSRRRGHKAQRKRAYYARSKLKAGDLTVATMQCEGM
jgi:hypothetical protein